MQVGVALAGRCRSNRLGRRGAVVCSGRAAFRRTRFAMSPHRGGPPKFLQGVDTISRGDAPSWAPEGRRASLGAHCGEGRTHQRGGPSHRAEGRANGGFSAPHRRDAPTHRRAGRAGPTAGAAHGCRNTAKGCWLARQGCCLASNGGFSPSQGCGRPGHHCSPALSGCSLPRKGCGPPGHGCSPAPNGCFLRATAAVHGAIEADTAKESGPMESAYTWPP
jgi:hypothetical protein